MKGQMWPIHGGSKAKRLKWDTPVNAISWAFMKELRENNKTKKIYEVDPYVEVYQFRDNMFGLFSPNCDGMGDVWMYLIVGPEKAMLIDTAYGLGDTKALVDEITGGKPLIVANTHDHFDHAYGNCRFDRVYCSEYLVPYLKMQHAHMWDYLFDAFGDNIWLDFDRSDLPVFRDYEIVGVPSGYTFDLGGGYEVELVWTGGHAAGHAMFIDKTDRILFAGDDICSDVSGCGNVNGFDADKPYAAFASIKTYRDNLEKLVARMDEFDYIFPAHFMGNLENNLLPRQLDALNAILADPENCDYKTVTYQKFPFAPPRVRYFKYIHGFSVIGYGYTKEAEEKGEVLHDR